MVAPAYFMKLTQPVKGKLKYAPDGIISQKFNDPTTPSDLLAFYKSLGLNGHNGIDFWGIRGTPIYAAHNGKVIYAQNTGGTAGLGIKLKGEGIYTLYFHNDELLVSGGESVSQGQIIAKMGNSGSSPQLYMAVHSHFGLYQIDPQGNLLNSNNGFQGAIDPLSFLIAEVNIMEYIILPNNEQYLYYEPLNLALNVGDGIELAKLQLHGLSGLPIKKDKLPNNCLIYPGTEQNRFRDLLGL